MKSLKQIKSKLKAVSHLEKITDAMEKVAAVKMKKIAEMAAKSRRYSFQAMKILADLKSKIEPLCHPLLKNPPKNKKNCLVLISSNKGLCGSFNSKLFILANGFLKDAKDDGYETDVVCVGKKGKDFIQKRCALKPKFEFIDIQEDILEKDIRAIFALSVDRYLSNDYSKVAIIYNDFISAAVQRPVIRQILPIDSDYLKEILESHGQKEIYGSYDYIFEPSPQEALFKILTELTRIQIFQALLDSKNSEYASRYMVMKNATEKSREIIGDLQLEFNKLRQAIITREISEITSGSL